MPTPTPPRSDQPSSAEITGPYDPQRNGTCACHGEPVNEFGRCHSLNVTEYPTTGGAKS